MADKEQIGKVFTYFTKIGVAGIKLTEGTLSKGDTISIEGATTNFEQTADSIQIDREEVEKAEIGQEVGIKVKDRVRPHDKVYKLS
ncbi:MAG: EF-Tu/IF-2/RF-3 family GTPase [Candidatus Hydrothermarchaeales archaeon]